MPCTDQTESLHLLLDEQDCVQTFQLRKISCGRAVGEETLLPYIQGKSIDEIIAGTVTELVPDLDRYRRIDEFLLFKQFFSVRAALLVLVGQSSGQPQQAFVMEELLIDEDMTQIKGEIAVNLISEEIRACGSCKSCRPLPSHLQDIADSLVQAS